MQRLSIPVLGVGIALASSWSALAEAQIRQPGHHPRYAVELEPHIVLGLGDPPGLGGGDGIGAGLFASLPLANDGFLPKLNDSVALRFGVDWVFYGGDDGVRAPCGRFVSGPNDTRVCVALGAEGGAASYWYLPVAMQWNFWLHPRASVFFEPGLEIHRLRYGDARYGDDTELGAGPLIDFGGRFHFADWAALTLRLGYPTSSLGVSFFL